MPIRHSDIRNGQGDIETADYIESNWTAVTSVKTLFKPKPIQRRPYSGHTL